MRNIKTAIAVSLSVFVSQLLKLEYPFYAAIATVISMQSSVSESFIVGRNRMLGTFIGAIFGLIGSLISQNNAVLCGIGIIVVIYLCNLLKWPKAVVISCVVFLVIMTNMGGRNPWIFSASRLIETFLGIAIAVIINYSIVPPKHIDKILIILHEVIDNIFIMSGTLICLNERIDAEELKKHISNLQKTLEVYKKEIRRTKKEELEIDKIENLIDEFHKVYHHLSFINLIEEDKQLNMENVTKLQKFYDNQADFKAYEHNDKNIIFNYHVNETINILNKLSKIKINKEELLK
jgi:uncharacterized membrane protein YgaE (UPF0421/DUF939 family)